jgi:hypothetical protein
VPFRVMESKFAATILRGKKQMIIDELKSKGEMIEVLVK